VKTETIEKNVAKHAKYWMANPFEDYELEDSEWLAQVSSFFTLCFSLGADDIDESMLHEPDMSDGADMRGGAVYLHSLDVDPAILLLSA
jgi:hypothetical protein